MTARRVARSRRWAGGLPALIVHLLLLVASGGVGRLADGPAVVGTESALGAGPAATQPAAAPRVDFRLLVKRSGHRSPSQVLVAGPVAVLRVAPPAGWCAVTCAAAVAYLTVRGEVCQGRAPPIAA